MFTSTRAFGSVFYFEVYDERPVVPCPVDYPNKGHAENSLRSLVALARFHRWSLVVDPSGPRMHYVCRSAPPAQLIDDEAGADGLLIPKSTSHSEGARECAIHPHG